MSNNLSVRMLEQIREEVTRRQADFLRELAWLVDIDSGTYTKAGVDRVADFVTERFGALGATVRRQVSEATGDVVVATFEGARRGARVLLIAHMDTVFETGTARERPYRTEAGRAYGPGVGDMKAGLLSGLYALAAIREVRRDEPTWLPVRRLVFIANPDEEIGSPVSTPLIRQHAAESDVVLVLEGARPGGEIVSARKGMLHARITMSGRSAHAGVEPEKGRHAILELAHKVMRLQALNGRWPGVTVNVGVVEGGSRPNIVPPAASLSLDARARTASEMRSVQAAIEGIAATSTVPDVTAELQTMASFPPMEKQAAGAELVARTTALAQQLGFDVRDVETGGSSDANTTAGLGVPTLDGLGPIVGGAHSADEYVELSSIVPRTSLLAGLLIDLGRTDHELGEDG